MKEQTKTVYSCDYCKKKYFVKHACENHEKFCSANPLTFPACTNCIHFEERKKEVYYERYPEDYTKEFLSFYCKKRQCGMYPLKALARNLPNRFPETFEGEILLPHECEFYQYLDDDTQSFLNSLL